MPFRLATYNVENLFSRARALDPDTWHHGREVLAEYQALNALLQHPIYTDSDKTLIVRLLEQLGLGRDNETEFLRLREHKGRLLRRGGPNGAREVVANGRGDWVGWVELQLGVVNELSARMTARVIADVGADILAVVEAEDRLALKRFNEQMLRPLGAAYRSIMLIDGNDERGIDVGLLTRPGFPITNIVSHIDDVLPYDDDELLFNRDCPEYTVRLPNGEPLLLLVNHFKSRRAEGSADAADADALREVQARRVREIYEQRRAEGVRYIAVLGDLNDAPYSEALAPLLAEGSDLLDISEHPAYDGGGLPGTRAYCEADDKLDYLLLSPALFARVTGGGVWRRGIWGGKHGTLFPHYPEIKMRGQAASDHAALWADVDL